MRSDSKNRVRLLALCLASALLSTACSADDLSRMTDAAGELSNVTKTIENAADSFMQAADTISNGTDALNGLKDTVEKTGIDFSGIKDEDSHDSKSARVEKLDSEYAFSKLNEEEKIVYDEILISLNAMDEDSDLSTKDEKVIDTAFNAVICDHPEIFWVKGYTYAVHTIDGEIVNVTFSGSFTATMEERDEDREAIERKADEILANVDRQASQYSQVKYVYDYLVKNTEYDLNAKNNQDIRSVFLNQASVCQGYTKATQYLLNKLDIFCTIVLGRADGSDHSWNLVQVDGNYYQLDTTWGDASYSRSGDYSGRVPSVNYDYFLVTDEEIKLTHDFDKPKYYPECTSNVSNYYIKEGLYFTSVDREQLDRVFEKAYADGEENISIKCASEDCLDEMLDYLIKEQHVFDYLKDSSSVNYATSQNSFTIIVWLE